MVPPAGAGPIVRTASGLLRGHRREGGGSLGVAFNGIPYAHDPRGEWRFAAPAPPLTWRGVRDATEARAPHPADSLLHLNVSTPDLDGRLPVLVWIHGGGFTSGSPLDEQTDGTTLNRHGVVMVSIAYRLGFDGFGHLPDAPDNRGVRDWIAALEWVQQNIAAFGGDPQQVTIGGHSAGGGAVLTLLTVSSARHLFQRAVSLSGALGEVPIDRARERARRLARLAGVAADRAGLLSVDTQRLSELLPRAATRRRGLAATAERIEGGLPWGPVIDGDLITGRVLERLRAGAGTDAPLLIGAADDEFTPGQQHRARSLRFIPVTVLLRRFIRDGTRRRSYLKANAERLGDGKAALLGRLVGDRICRALVPSIAAARPAGAPTWTYRFAWPSPSTGWSSHTVDIPFWFDGLDRPRALASFGADAPQAVADAMHTALIAFVRSGDPGWPAWRPHTPTTRSFGALPELSTTAYDGVLPLIADG